MIRALLYFISCVISFSSLGNSSKLPVPRFASIKTNEVNARTGPSIKCPIEWVFVKKGEPVEIIAEYEQWRQIRDIKGEGGWVHLSVLSGKRYVIITETENGFLKKDANDSSKVVAQLMPQVRCSIRKCLDKWCKVVCKEIDGWITRTSLWGVYPDEKLK